MAQIRYPDSFWSHVTKTDGCWLWRGGPVGDSYGMSWDGSKNRKAHRLSWEIANGPIPDGLSVCHHCDNPRCVRPDHLFLGTNGDNVRDRDLKKRGAYASGNGARCSENMEKGAKLCRERTHCPAGHAYSGRNLRINSSGHRRCRECCRKRVFDKYHADKNATLSLGAGKEVRGE
jgi:hypothetical protein